MSLSNDNTAGSSQRYKLRVNFVGTDAYDTSENLLPYRKLIYIATGAELVGNVRNGIETMFRELYPEDGRCEVAQLRDSHLCDVSDNFMVSDVFDESPEVYAAMKGLQDESRMAPHSASMSITDEPSQIIVRPKRRRYTMTPSKGALGMENELVTTDCESLTRMPKITRLENTADVDTSSRLDLNSPEPTTPVCADQPPKRTVMYNGGSPAPVYPYSHDKTTSKTINQSASTPQSPVSREYVTTTDASPLGIPQSAKILDIISPEINTSFTVDADNTTPDTAVGERLSETAVNTPRPAATVCSDSPSKAREHARPKIEVVVRRTTRLSKASAGGSAMSDIVDASNSTPQSQDHKRKAVDFSSSSDDESDKNSADSAMTATADNSTGAVATKEPVVKKPTPRTPKAKAASGANAAAATTPKTPIGAVSATGKKTGQKAAASVHSTSNNVQPSPANQGNSAKAPVAAQATPTKKAAAANAKKPSKVSVAKRATASGLKVATKTPAKSKKDKGTASFFDVEALSDGKGGSSSGDGSSNEEEVVKPDSTPIVTKGKVGASKLTAKSKAAATGSKAMQAKGTAKDVKARMAAAVVHDKDISSSEECSGAEGSQSDGESASSSSGEELLSENESSSSDESSNEEPSDKGKPNVVVQSKMPNKITKSSVAANGGKDDGESGDSGTESEGGFSVESDSSLESDEGENVVMVEANDQPDTKSAKTPKGAARKKINGSTGANNQRVGATNGVRSTQPAGPTTPPATPPPTKGQAETEAVPTPGTKRRTPKRKRDSTESGAPTTASRRKVTLSKPPILSEENGSSESEDDESDIPLKRLANLPMLGTPTMPRRTSGVLELARNQRAGKDGVGVMSISQLASTKPYEELRKKMAKYASVRGMTNLAGGDSRVQNKAEAAAESSSDSDSSSSSGAEMDVEFDTDVGKGRMATANGGGSSRQEQQQQQQQQQQQRWRPIRFAGSVKLTGSAKARRRKSALMSL